MYKLIFLVIFLVGCASNNPSIEMKYQFRDDPENKKFILSYTNHTQYKMCLDAEMWPNSSGAINTDRMFLIVGGEAHQIKETNTGYCPGGCSEKVFPGETVERFIQYIDFDLPNTSYRKPKAIEFSPKVYRCK